MGGRYLQKVNSAVVSSGRARVSVGPDQGEFWAPSLVTVTAQPFAPNNSLYSALLWQPFCTLYRGSAGSPTEQQQFVDDTALGRGDATSIVAGTILSRGEVLTAEWVNLGGLGVMQTGVLTVYGRVFDSMQEVQDELSPVPGTRFAGTQGNALQWDRVDSFSASATYANNTVLLTATTTQLEIIDIQFTITTSATAGNRLIGLAVESTVGNVIPVYRAFADVVQAASTTYVYSFSAGGPKYGQGPPAVGTNGEVGVTLPPKVIVPSGFQVRFKVNNPVAGDTLTNVSLTWRQYKSQNVNTYL